MGTSVVRASSVSDMRQAYRRGALVVAVPERIDGGIDKKWRAFIAAKRETIISDENHRPDESRVFVETAFREGQIRTSGTAITKTLQPVSRFSAVGGRGEKQHVVQKRGVFS